MKSIVGKHNGGVGRVERVSLVGRSHRLHYKEVENVYNKASATRQYSLYMIISSPISQALSFGSSTESIGLSSGEKLRLTLLTQCLSSVGVGYPSPLKTCPK